MENSFEQFSLSVSTFLEANRGLIIIAAVVMLVLGAAFALRRKGGQKSAWTVRELSAAAMCLALAFLLSYLRLWKMPQGGSVTPASMLPIMLFAYIYGTPKGLIVGLAYGLLQCLQDFWIVHWAQFLLDYIAGFVVLGLAGLLRKNIFAGMGIAGVLRFIMHVISGAVFFGEYAEPGQSPWAYSLGYNSFALIELGLCVVVTALPPVYKMIQSLKNRVGKPIDDKKAATV